MRLLWISRPPHSRYYMMEKFVNAFCKLSGCENIQEKHIRHEEINQYNGIIVTWLSNHMYIDWDKIKIPKFAYHVDVHTDIHAKAKTAKAAMKIKKAKVFLEQFDYQIVKYRDAWERRHPDVDAFWLPHSIDPTICKDWKQNRKYNILVSGHTGKKGVYKLRREIASKLQHIPRFHRAKGFYHREEYSKLLNSSQICVSSTSKYKYPVAKTFEIPASYSVLLSDLIPEMSDIGFKDSVTMIKYDRDIVDKVEYYLKNKDKLNVIRKNCYEMVHEKHTVTERAVELLDFIEDKI